VLFVDVATTPMGPSWVPTFLETDNRPSDF